MAPVIRSMLTVDIVLSVHNGRRYIADQLRSLQAQTHEDWRLWVRDDGSADDTSAVVQAFADSDPRIRLHPLDGQQRGVSGGFSWLLMRLPPDSRYVACCDADDVWIPQRIEATLAALVEAEEESRGPVLVHTDLTVTDADMGVTNPSLWNHMGIQPEPTPLRRLLIQNVVTGPTILMNRELVDRVVPIEPEVTSHDWWIALVAAAVGRIVALRESTVLYRRHGENHTGAYPGGVSSLFRVFSEGFEVWKRTPHLRWLLAATAQHAELLRERVGEELSPEENRFLEAYAEIPRLGFLRRKLRVLRLRTLPEHGVARNVALLLRA